MQLLGIVVGCVLASGPASSAERNAGGFDCASIVSDVIATTKENRDNAKAELLSIEEVSTASEDVKRLECRGIGIWTDASKGPIRFFAHEEYGKWWIEYQPG